MRWAWSVSRRGTTFVWERSTDVMNASSFAGSRSFFRSAFSWLCRSFLLGWAVESPLSGSLDRKVTYSSGA